MAGVARGRPGAVRATAVATAVTSAVASAVAIVVASPGTGGASKALVVPVTAGDRAAGLRSAGPVVLDR
ncbi:hypothetical protein B1L11_40680 [Microbispora sp. GKU 823]|nr:hypothetical protein B1L11_40680 [Microbispora sp. GKU 823]